MNGISSNDDDWCRCGENVLFQIPTWLTRDVDDYVTSLLAFSVPQLYSVVQSLHVSCRRRKYDFIKVIVDDFLSERLQLWKIVMVSEGPCVSVVSRHFQA